MSSPTVDLISDAVERDINSPNKKEPNDNVSNVLNEAARMAISGVIAGCINDMVFYGLDSYKITKQAGCSIPFSQLFRGTFFFPIIGAMPACGTFFFSYSLLYSLCTSSMGLALGTGSAVLTAATISSLPATLIAVPADVLKKQFMLNNAKLQSVKQSVVGVYRKGGIKAMFLGWQANILREVPTTAIEMTLYETIAWFYLYKYQTMETTSFHKLLANNHDLKENNDHTIDYQKISTRSTTAVTSGARASTLLNSYEAATVGFLAGSISSILTCPIDCVNTRMKSGEMGKIPFHKVPFRIIKQDGIAGLFRGLAPRATIAGCGGLVFWYLQATLKQQLILNGL